MKLSEYDYLIIVALAKHNYESIYEKEDLVSNFPTPEEFLIKKEWWENRKSLSKDAQEIINYSLSNGSRKEKLTKYQISIHFRNKGWKWRRIWNAFDEIKEWLCTT